MSRPKFYTVMYEPNPALLDNSNPTAIVEITAEVGGIVDVVLINHPSFSKAPMMEPIAQGIFFYQLIIDINTYVNGENIDIYNFQAIGPEGEVFHDEALTVIVDTGEGEGGGEGEGEGGGGYTTVDTTNVNSISLTANINMNVIEEGGNYGLIGGGFDIGRAGEFNAVYNLPAGTINLNCGSIAATLPNMTQGGLFDPFITLNANSQGDLTASVSINGSPVTATVSENTQLAQQVIWSTENIAPTVSSTSDDVLSSAVTNTDVSSYFSTEIQAIQNAYSYNVLQYWNFDIREIPAVAGSLINAYAQENGRTAVNMFLNGEHIVLETTYPYSVKVIDMQNVEQTIVAETPIYAIVYHNDAAPPLQ